MPLNIRTANASLSVIASNELLDQIEVLVGTDSDFSVDLSDIKVTGIAAPSAPTVTSTPTASQPKQESKLSAYHVPEGRDHTGYYYPQDVDITDYVGKAIYGPFKVEILNTEWNDDVIFTSDEIDNFGVAMTVARQFQKLFNTGHFDSTKGHTLASVVIAGFDSDHDKAQTFSLDVDTDNDSDDDDEDY